MASPQQRAAEELIVEYVDNLADVHNCRQIVWSGVDSKSPLDAGSTHIGIRLKPGGPLVAVVSIAITEVGRLGPRFVEAFGGDKKRVLAWVYKLGVDPAYQGEGIGHAIKMAAVSFAVGRRQVQTLALVAQDPGFYSGFMTPRLDDSFVMPGENGQPSKLVVPCETALGLLRTERALPRGGPQYRGSSPGSLVRSLPAFAS